ncbi:VOC family protein [Mucilaginibacter sp. UC70_90]
MENTINGIHHITAIAGNAKKNYDFYTRVLGLRLVKKTVNFDDPGTYHLYYGDGERYSRLYPYFLPLGRHHSRSPGCKAGN